MWPSRFHANPFRSDGQERISTFKKTHRQGTRCHVKEQKAEEDDQKEEHQQHKEEEEEISAEARKEALDEIS